MHKTLGSMVVSALMGGRNYGEQRFSPLTRVTAENVKEFKLPGERGVVIGKVLEDSPAAKAGLKDNDVVTEINGQRDELVGKIQEAYGISRDEADRQVKDWEKLN